MPESPPTRCIDCGELYSGSACDKCKSPSQKKGWDASKSWGDKGGSTWAWRKVRARRLAITPFCVWCGETDKKKLVADHLDGTDYQDNSKIAPSWLALDMIRTLCKRCHAERTQAESAAARRRVE
jgi:5-methylcytosine-specific restriction endonuclease McrA